MVTGGGVGNVIDAVHLNLPCFANRASRVRAIVANKLAAEKRELTLDYLRRGFSPPAFQVFGGFNYQAVLANPTLRRISRMLDEPLHGDRRQGRAHHPPCANRCRFDPARYRAVAGSLAADRHQQP
jgi:hypothetical protein